MNEVSTNQNSLLRDGAYSPVSNSVGTYFMFFFVFLPFFNTRFKIILGFSTFKYR